MPLRLNVGVTRKVGLPGYGSAGAACSLEIELDGSMLESDRAGLSRRVHAAYAFCRSAVSEELIHAGPPGASAGSARCPSHDAAPPRAREGRSRLATVKQTQALRNLARDRSIPLADLLRTEFGVDEPGALEIAEASRLIARLKERPCP